MHGTGAVHRSKGTSALMFHMVFFGGGNVKDYRWLHAAQRSGRGRDGTIEGLNEIGQRLSTGSIILRSISDAIKAFCIRLSTEWDSIPFPEDSTLPWLWNYSIKVEDSRRLVASAGCSSSLGGNHFDFLFLRRLLNGASDFRFRHCGSSALDSTRHDGSDNKQASGSNGAIDDSQSGRKKYESSMK